MCLYKEINSQSLEATQVGYILQKYTLDNYTLEKYTLAQKSLVMVATSLVMVSTSLVMIPKLVEPLNTPIGEKEWLLWDWDDFIKKKILLQDGLPKEFHYSANRYK